MRASRIFALARSSRCAIVVSGQRKARAISAVVRPPSNRSVSATCDGVASAGWQQVKIRRNRSSRTAPSSIGSSGVCSCTAWSSRSPRVASRRSRSIARLRPVVMIQPAALGGRPRDGPALERDGERILDRLLGEVDVAELARQHGHGAAVLLAEHTLDLRGGQLRHAGVSPSRPRERGEPRSAASSPGPACAPTRARRRGPAPRRS